MSTVAAPRSPRQAPSASRPAPSGLSVRRLSLLRFGYLVVGVGLAVVKWPALVDPDRAWSLDEGVVESMLLALSVLALVGLRYPVQMLPVLLFESAWKLIWLGVVALPLWTSGRMDPATEETALSVLWVVIVLAVVPWPYVADRYVRQRSERWRSADTRTAQHEG